MEFVEGETLRSMMRNGLKLKNSLSIAGQDEIRGIGISDDDRLLYFSIY